MNFDSFKSRKSGLLVPKNFSLSYEAARYSRHRKWLPIVSTDSQSILTPAVLAQLRSQGRHWFINDGLVRGAFRDRANYMIGNAGILPMWDTGDPGWDKEMQIRFLNWMRIADLRRKLHFNQILRASSIEMDTDGDFGFILTTTGGGNEAGGIAQIQTVRAHRITDPKGENPSGIIEDRNGRTIAVRIRQGDADGYRDIPAASFILIGDPDLSDWSRYPSAIAHGMNTIQDSREIQGFIMDGLKSRTARAFFHKTPTGEVDEDDLLDAEGNPVTDGDQLSLEEIQGGEIPRLGPGEEIIELESDFPNQMVMPTLEFNHRSFMVGYGTPLEVVWGGDLKGPTQRYFLSKFQRAVDNRRGLIYIPHVLTRIASFFAACEIKRGAMPMPAGGVFYAKRFVATSPNVTIDAGREAQQNREDILLGSRSLEEDAGERGVDWEELRDQCEREAADLVDRAKRLAKEKDITFEIALSLLSRRTPNGNLPTAPDNSQATPPVEE